MQTINVEGLEIEVDLLPDGTLEVYRDGEFRGMLLVTEPGPPSTPPDPAPKLLHQPAIPGESDA